MIQYCWVWKPCTTVYHQHQGGNVVHITMLLLPVVFATWWIIVLQALEALQNRYVPIGSNILSKTLPRSDYATQDMSSQRHAICFYTDPVYWMTPTIWHPRYQLLEIRLLTWINFNLSSNYINYNVWDDLTYPFTNFNGVTSWGYTVNAILTSGIVDIIISVNIMLLMSKYTCGCNFFLTDTIS